VYDLGWRVASRVNPCGDGHGTAVSAVSSTEGAKAQGVQAEKQVSTASQDVRAERYSAGFATTVEEKRSKLGGGSSLLPTDLRKIKSVNKGRKRSENGSALTLSAKALSFSPKEAKETATGGSARVERRRVKAKTAVGRAHAGERPLHSQEVQDPEAEVQEEPVPLGRADGSDRSMAIAVELHCIHEGEQSVVSNEEGLELWQVFVNKEWSLCGRATWSDFAIAYTPPEQGNSAFHAVQRATTRHGFGKDPNGRREEAFGNKRLLAATDLRLRATERIGNAHSKGNLVMGELVSNDRREVKVWDHLSAWG
jgi:hypothetical protein